MKNTSIFSKRIKELRESVNMSQKEFADSVGTTQTTLSSYETTDKIPSLSIVKTIAEKYSVSLDWLCGLSNSKNHKYNIVTYADFFNTLFTLDKALDIHFLPNHVNDVDCDGNGNPIPCTAYIQTIYFNNTEISDFLNEWEKMKSLHSNKTIDDEVYALWIEKTLKKYSNENLDGSFNVDDSDGELPFN